MNYGEVFLYIRIAILLLAAGLQYASWRVLHSALARRFPRRRVPEIFAALVVIGALPGIYIVFLGKVAVPAPLQVGMVAAYAAWNAALVFLAAYIYAARKLADRRGSARVTRELPAAQPAVPDPGRRAFLHGAAGISILSFTGAAVSVSGEEEFEIAHRTLRLPDLPEKLKGLKIAALSDIHSGPFMSKDDLLPYAKAVNRLSPDVILLPGDFVQNRNEEIEPVCEVFRTLEAPFGVYGSTGNHDYFADADYIARELENAGVRMLRNEHLVLDPHGERLALIGLDDVRDSHPFDALFQTAVRGLDPGVPNILLCHKPYYLEEASEWGVDFMLSGHTHGGQIVLARLLGMVITPAALISGYVEGFYSMDDTSLYVTRGIGTVGLPVRVNCPPEITLFTLA
jgi:predicted MPP superfamily phosphohydrolase